MNKYKFNKYCVEVMGYEVRHKEHGAFTENPDNDTYVLWVEDEREGRWYNPFDDLNQMVEVFDVLWNRCRTSKSYITKCLSFSPKGDCKKAIRDFIISCMETNYIAETTND